ncbi:MAG: YggU family protein [Peptococcaceae bacterium]|nr:YggU family protein [Peptococcaceae bacterium]
MSDWYIKGTEDGTVLKVRLQPRASKNEITGLYGDALKVRVTSPPVDGKANKALCSFLAKLLKVAAGQIVITAGVTGREKTVLIRGISPAEIQARLQLTDNSV